MYDGVLPCFAGFVQQHMQWLAPAPCTRVRSATWAPDAGCADRCRAGPWLLGDGVVHLLFEARVRAELSALDPIGFAAGARLWTGTSAA
ncbi:hypothetical protein [Streptomyces sp. NPDC056010]|uniref:hypothetical protein n=1 Tax=Streptomyces sp. NPDC056010 TaxID=3345679 RepID=UPI0035D82943